MELSSIKVRQLLFLTLISPRATHSTIIKELKTKIATFYFLNKKKRVPLCDLCVYITEQSANLYKQNKRDRYVFRINLI